MQAQVLDLEQAPAHPQTQAPDPELARRPPAHPQKQAPHLEPVLGQLLDLELACSLVVALTPLGT